MTESEAEVVARWKREGYLARCDKHGDQTFRFNESEDRFECPAIGSAFDDCHAHAQDGRVNEVPKGQIVFCNADKWGGYEGGKPRTVNG